MRARAWNTISCFSISARWMRQRFPEIAARQAWFRDTKFRQAISSVVDREAIVRLVYGGRATALWGHVTPANRAWLNAALPKPARSVERARRLLQEAGFHWNAEGALLDASGKIDPVFHPGERQQSGARPDGHHNSGRSEEARHSNPGSFARVPALWWIASLNSRQYEACILGLVSGDADPNPEMNVWLSSGGSHLWNPGQNQPMTPWEAEIDRLMRQQMTTLDHAERKRLYDRVQQIAAENLPLICLASPDILVAARKNLGNFQPAVVDHYTLWNAEQLYWRQPSGARARGVQ